MKVRFVMWHGLYAVWGVDLPPVVGSRFPDHPAQDYLAGFLDAAGRDWWVKLHGFEVVA